jgi:hypothetical protein
MILIKKIKSTVIDYNVGPGLSIRKSGASAVVHDTTRKKQFRGAFCVDGNFKSEEVFECTVGIGFVNMIEPEIRGLKISGVDEDGWPLPGGKPMLSGAEYGPQGICYICLDITIDDDGNIESPIEVIMSPRCGQQERNLLHPIAAFGKDGEIFQMAYFDYTHSAVRMRQIPNTVLDDPKAWIHYMVPNLGDNFFSNNQRPAPAIPPVNSALVRWL